MNKEIIKEIIILLIGFAVATIFFNIIFSTIILWIILLRKTTESTAIISLWGRSIFGVLWILVFGFIYHRYRSKEILRKWELEEELENIE